MTTVAPRDAVDNGSTTASERQAAARAAWRSSLEAGTPLTGAELGRRFGCTDRWGRMQISKFRAELDTGNGSGTGQHDRSADSNGNQPPPPERNTHGTNRGETSRAAHLLDTHPEPAPDPHSARPRQDGGRQHRRPWLDTAITLAVAAVAAAASYGHMLDVALMAGEPVWIARLFPATVDGLVLAALRRGDAGRRWLALGVAVSIAANVLAQFPDLAATVGPVVSAWPPLALYGTHRLLHGRTASRSTP